jgi:alpha-tubulin suppressor-like RCC1 family protein
MSIAIPCYESRGGVKLPELKDIAAALHLKIPARITKRQLCEQLNAIADSKQAAVIAKQLEKLGFEVNWQIEKVFYDDRKKARDGTQLVRVKWVGYPTTTYEPLSSVPHEPALPKEEAMFQSAQSTPEPLFQSARATPERVAPAAPIVAKKVATTRRVATKRVPKAPEAQKAQKAQKQQPKKVAALPATLRPTSPAPLPPLPQQHLLVPQEGVRVTLAAMGRDRRVVAISAGYFHSLALQADGQIRAWGKTEHTNVPPLEGTQRYVAISAGKFHSLALRSDETIVTWGLEAYIEEKGLRRAPDIPNGRRIVQISAASTYSVVLLDNGEVLGWGAHFNQQAVGLFKRNKCVALCAGSQRLIALQSDGKSVDIVGERSLVNPGVPIGRRCVAIGTSKFDNRSAVVLETGDIVDWRDDRGAASGVASRMLAKKHAVAVSVGPSGCLYLDAAGRIGCWMHDFAFNPIKCNHNGDDVPALPDKRRYIAISAGGGHYLALRDDGVVVGWGLNIVGQAIDIRDSLPLFEKYLSVIEEIFGRTAPQVQELHLLLESALTNLTTNSIEQLQNKLTAFSNRYLNQPKQLGQREQLKEESWQCDNATDLVDELAFPGQAEPIRDVPPKDFLRLHNVCWNMRQLVLLIKETLHGRNENIVDPDYLREKRAGARVQPPPIWEDEYEKQALLSHPSGQGQALVALLDQRARAAGIVRRETAHNMYQAGSIFWSRGEPFETEIRKALTPTQLKKWNELKKGLLQFELPRNLPATLLEKITTLKSKALSHLIDYWRTLQKEEQDAMLFLASVSAEEFTQCLQGLYCVMSMGRSLLQGYNVWAKFHDEKQLEIPGLPLF